MTRRLLSAALLWTALAGGQSLNALLPGPQGFDLPSLDPALRKIRQTKDTRWAAPLADLLPFIKDRDSFLGVTQTLEAVTRTKIPVDRAIEAASLWVGAQESMQELPGYAAWKGELLARMVDPRYRELLFEGIPAAMRVAEVQWGGVQVNGIPALIDPKMIPAGEASYLIPTEPVFGVSVNGDHRAYPLRILDWHEMANDIVGGQSVALAYCTLCGAGILYGTTLSDGSRLGFGSSGLLARSNKLMFDANSLSLWNQFTGEPVFGKLVASKIKLPVLPLVLTSWQEWRARHPDTKVLDINTGHKRQYEVGATYGRYFGSAGTMFPVWKQSARLPKKARVYALRVDGAPKAYPLDELNKAGGVANDELGARTVLVIHKDAVGQVELPPDWAADTGKKYANGLALDDLRALIKKKPERVKQLTVEMMLAVPVEARLTILQERTPDEPMGTKAGKGQFTPEFRNHVAQRGLIAEVRAYERGSHTFRMDGAVLKDEAGREWQITEPHLIGPGGEKLVRLPGHLAFWFGWFAFMPNSAVYEAR
ncbi:MAG: DUF3179 domain-containing protein [Acidobacteria bacterium]|nr:DUF3179 domain-containing protein [Acidobacteriota bacterium]